MQDDRDRAARGQHLERLQQTASSGARPPNIVRIYESFEDHRSKRHHHGDVHRRRARLADEDAPPRLRREGGGDPRREDARPPSTATSAASSTATSCSPARAPRAPARPPPHFSPPARPAVRRRAHRLSLRRLDNFIYEDEDAESSLSTLFAVEVAPAEAMGRSARRRTGPELWADHAKEYDRRPPPQTPARPPRPRLPPPAPRPPAPRPLTRRAFLLRRWTCGRSAW